MTLEFQGVDEPDGETAESYAASYCDCGQPDVRLEITEGVTSWWCESCTKAMSDWFVESAEMAPVKVTFTIEPGHCTCNMMDQLSCDCAQWPLVMLVPEGESVDKETAGG